MPEELPQKKESEAGAIWGIGIILAVFLIGGFFFWKHDVQKLRTDRELVEASWYDDSEDQTVTDTTSYDDQYDIADFSGLDQGI